MGGWVGVLERGAVVTEAVVVLVLALVLVATSRSQRDAKTRRALPG